MLRIAVAAVAILLAAGVAYIWVVPGGFDLIGVKVATDPESTQPAKDDSRISTPSSPAADADEAGENPEVGALDPASLPFELGCGLYLTREGEDGIIFANSMEGETNGVMPASMVIDGSLVALERTTADGEPIGFGQYPRQVFDTPDNQTRVVVEVDFGEPNEPDDLPVTAGEITVMKAGRMTLKIPVSGGAGC